MSEAFFETFDTKSPPKPKRKPLERKKSKTTPKAENALENLLKQKKDYDELKALHGPLTLDDYNLRIAEAFELKNNISKAIKKYHRQINFTQRRAAIGEMRKMHLELDGLITERNEHLIYASYQKLAALDKSAGAREVELGDVLFWEEPPIPLLTKRHSFSHLRPSGLASQVVRVYMKLSDLIEEQPDHYLPWTSKSISRVFSPLLYEFEEGVLSFRDKAEATRAHDLMKALNKEGQHDEMVTFLKNLK